MNLNEFFPYQVCINLDSRPDRWQRISARFAEHGINQVVRFPAVEGKRLEMPSVWHNSPGAYGCLRSHLAVVEQARREAQPSVLIFEDDAVLAADFKTKFADYVKQLPDDWDMVFFGGLHGEPLTKVANNVVRVSHSLSTYAYALKHTIYDGFIELNQQALALLDQNTRALQKRFNCYCFMPHLAWVEEDYSDIRGEKVNLWWLQESLVLFGSEMDEIMKNTVAVISYRNENPAAFRNLLFTTDYLRKELPGITLLVLEQGLEPSLKPSDLPPNCHLEMVGNSAAGNLSHALQRGFERFTSSKDFFIFLDSDVFLTREDLRANLLQCRSYDVTRAFREIYDLNEADTLRILQGDVCWNYGGAYSSRQKAMVFDACCIITRQALCRMLEGEKSFPQSAAQWSMKAEERLRVYDSPNLARRLSSD